MYEDQDQEIRVSGRERQFHFEDDNCSAVVTVKNDFGFIQQFQNDVTKKNEINRPNSVCLCVICYNKFNPEQQQQQEQSQFSTSTSTPGCINNKNNGSKTQPSTFKVKVKAKSNLTSASINVNNVNNVNSTISSTSKELFDIFCRYMNFNFDVDLSSSSSVIDIDIVDAATLDLALEPELMDYLLSMNNPFCKLCSKSLQELLDYHEHIQRLLILTKQITATLATKLKESFSRNMKMKDCQSNSKASNTQSLSSSSSSVSKDEEKMDALRQFIYDRYNAKFDHDVNCSKELQRQRQSQVCDSDSDGNGNQFENSNSDEHISDDVSNVSGRRSVKQNNKLVEISTNEFLYGNKYFVKKVKDKFKCCTCGKRLERKYKLLEHIRVTHIRGETCERTRNKKIMPVSSSAVASRASTLKNSNILLAGTGTKTKIGRKAKSGTTNMIEAESKTNKLQKNCAQTPAFEKFTIPDSTMDAVDVVEVEMMEYDNDKKINSLDTDLDLDSSKSIPISSQNSKLRSVRRVNINQSNAKEMVVGSVSDSDSDSDSDDNVEMNQGGKRYVEIEPNKFLYDKQYIFEKIGEGYKCQLCGFQDERFGKMCEHVRRSHIKVRKTTRVNNKWVEVSPDKYVYAYKYTVEKIEGRFKCCTCKYTSKGKYEMFKHLRTKHLNPVEGFMCDNCGKQFRRQYALGRHKKFACINSTPSDSRLLDKNGNENRNHELQICPVCGKSFKNEYYLKKHERLHEGEDKKKFQCEYCGRKFWNASRLKDHRTQHTGEKLFQCRFCDQSFTTYNNMHYHRSRAHGRVGELVGVGSSSSSSYTTQIKK